MHIVISSLFPPHPYPHFLYLYYLFVVYWLGDLFLFCSDTIFPNFQCSFTITLFIFTILSSSPVRLDGFDHTTIYLISLECSIFSVVFLKKNHVGVVSTVQSSFCNDITSQFFSHIFIKAFIAGALPRTKNTFKRLSSSIS